MHLALVLNLNSDYELKTGYRLKCHGHYNNDRFEVYYVGRPGGSHYLRMTSNVGYEHTPRIFFIRFCSISAFQRLVESVKVYEALRRVDW